MRVTTAAKEATRQRIREAARDLFQSQGFEETTTRDIARDAGIAAGTLFNYFASKESLVLDFVAEVFEQTEAAYRKRIRETMTLDEDLFLYVATGFRQLHPLRGYLRPALESVLSPAAMDGEGASLRVGHLEAVGSILQKHRPSEPPNAVQLQMYWMLYTGLIAFWVSDRSAKQEDTLALLDHSLQMYVHWLSDPQAP